MIRNIVYWFVGLLIFATNGAAQSLSVSVSGIVCDEQTRQPLPFATIQVKADNGKMAGTASDEKGRFDLRNVSLGKDEATLIVSYVGYQSLTRRVSLKKNLFLSLYLKPLEENLHEVVVTASESRDITSASRIDRTAMEHLQPTSFTDLLALLPGGSTSNPVMNRANIITLREAGISSSNYDTGSLGTQFIIDGTPLNVDANLQSITADISDFSDRSSVNAGVDMRQISTDNIESVEIVRGIPSVQYSDLTSGLVLIKRKLSASPLEARFKADQYGKLFAAGKGVEWEKQNFVLNADLSYMDSKADPRDRNENYKRINTSVRTSKRWYPSAYLIRWNATASYNANIDGAKTDPDIGVQNSYKSNNHSLALTNLFTITPVKEGFFRGIDLNLSANMSWDKIKRSRLTVLDRDRIAPTHITQYDGEEYDAEILPYKYMAYLTVDGKPLNLYASLNAHFEQRTGFLYHKLLVGGKWNYAKNYGEGQVYDITRPLDPTYHSTRPRRYCDIPASEKISLFVEDRMQASWGKHRFELQVGVSANQLLNLDSRFAMDAKYYLDPRVNAQWKLPAIALGGDKLNIDLTAGMGYLTKMPTLDMLYPETLYHDIAQLSYYHINKEYRRVNLVSYIIDPTNYDIKPAKNLKWEVRLGFDYHQNTFSLTYFREDMKNGFRSVSEYLPYTYKDYDESSIDASTLTGPPSLETIPYEVKTRLDGHSKTGNGSRTLKQGIEFQLATERFKGINTRFTVNGAWFRTIYQNSLPQYYSVSNMVGNVAVSDLYVGVYNQVDDYLREYFNTNFIIDTSLPKLGLKFSVTAECQWYAMSQNKDTDGTPIAYIDTTGERHTYTEADKSDIYKRYLVRDSRVGNTKIRTPFYAYLNFKVTKEFTKNIGMSLFIDRLVDYVPDYTRNGVEVRRTAASPYFGMEMNIKL